MRQSPATRPTARLPDCSCAQLLSAEDGLRTIRNNVDRIVVEARPKPTPLTLPPTAAAKPDDLERRLHDVERKLDELLARSEQGELTGLNDGFSEGGEGNDDAFGLSVSLTARRNPIRVISLSPRSPIGLLAVGGLPDERVPPTRDLLPFPAPTSSSPYGRPLIDAHPHLDSFLGRMSLKLAPPSSPAVPSSRARTQYGRIRIGCTGAPQP